MAYYINLENISIDNYKEKLKKSDLLKSRMILKDNIDSNFKLINNQNINSVDGLLIALKNKKKLQDFSIQSSISEEFLTILIREIKSFRQNPNRIKDFQCIPNQIVLRFEKIGIKNTFQLFDKILTEKSREELSTQTGIDKELILFLTKLTDLSRIRWVKHTFAYVLHEAGFDTAEKVAKADYNNLYETIKKLKQERELYKGHIGLNDMKLCVDAAKEVDLEIEY